MIKTLSVPLMSGLVLQRETIIVLLATILTHSRYWGTIPLSKS